MISKKIKNIINEFANRNENILLQNEYIKKQLEELEWANIFHDTIKDRSWLRGLAVSPGRWAANYSFFYILVRALSDYKPNKIIEFGLGETSKIVSAFLNNELHSSSHLIIEQDENWINAFKSKFNLSLNSVIEYFPIGENTVNNYSVKSYYEINKKITGTFDLYIVDGPHGSDHFSRHDICLLSENLKSDDEFIIIMDDYNREGEKETAAELISLLTAKEIKIYSGVFSGNKSQIIITTERYRFITSM